VILAFGQTGPEGPIYIRYGGGIRIKIKKSSRKDKVGSRWHHCRFIPEGRFTHAIRVPAVSDAAF
jgi:hypothetical protein